MEHTTQLLASLRQETEQFLRIAIAEWQMLPADSWMPASGAEGAWSAAQCLEHLNIYGRYYLPAIDKALREAGRRGDRPAATFRSGWLGRYFTRLMRPQGDGQVKSKMKAPKNAEPSPDPDARATVAEFIDQQETLLKLLDRAAAVNLERARVPISIAPWLRLKLGDTFSFLVAHTERHVRQAERAMEKSRALLFHGLPG